MLQLGAGHKVACHFADETAGTTTRRGAKGAGGSKGQRFGELASDALPEKRLQLLRAKQLETFCMRAQQPVQYGHCPFRVAREVHRAGELARQVAFNERMREIRKLHCAITRNRLVGGKKPRCSFRLFVQHAALFDAVEREFRVRGRWMRRRDDPTTYMEVYEGIEDEGAFEALLEREGARLGVPRKIERFVCA